jgi:hypothetical protein
MGLPPAELSISPSHLMPWDNPAEMRLAAPDCEDALPRHAGALLDLSKGRRLLRQEAGPCFGNEKLVVKSLKDTAPC